jgi:putative endopeptidase
MLGQSGYTGATEAQKNAYLQYISTLLTLGGMEAAEAAEEARLFWDTEAALADQSLPVYEAANVDKTYNVFTMSQLKELFPHIDLDVLFSLTGMTQTDHIVVSDVGQMAAAAALFDQAHLRTLKAFSRIALLSGFGTCLNEEFKQASDAFSAAYLGTSGNLSDADYAAQVVQNLLSELLGQAYVSRYFSPAAKSDAEDMVSEIVEVYKQRIQALPWMSGATKARPSKSWHHGR